MYEIVIFWSNEMVKLKNIWIENDFGEKQAIRIDWDNDQHQRIEIAENTPEAVAHALKVAGSLVNAEMVQKKTYPTNNQQ